MLPTLFISHGSPQLVIMKHEVSNFFKQLPKMFEKPKYIIIVSAHWASYGLKILAREEPSIIYDFYGFPKELYDKKYPLKNDTNRVEEVIVCLEKHGLHIEKSMTREGYDHGVWAPLSLMYENAGIPVIQLSLPMDKNTDELLKIGEALGSLREEALIIGSGNMTHNLYDSAMGDVAAPIKEYAKVFRDEIVKKIEKGDVDLLQKTLYVKENHPTLEHFLPIFIAMGALKNRVGKAILDVYMYANQSMEMIVFED